MAFLRFSDNLLQGNHVIFQKVSWFCNSLQTMIIFGLECISLLRYFHISDTGSLKATCEQNILFWPFVYLKKRTIADVAVTKHYQRLDELVIFLPALYRKSAKLFTRRRCQKCLHFLQVYAVWNSTHFLLVYSKRMLCEHDCVKLHGRIAWHSFLENNFAEFLDEVLVKINWNFRPAVGGVSLKQYLLLWQKWSNIYPRDAGFQEIFWFHEILLEITWFQEILPCTKKKKKKKKKKKIGKHLSTIFQENFKHFRKMWPLWLASLFLLSCLVLMAFKIMRTPCPTPFVVDLPVLRECGFEIENQLPLFYKIFQRYRIHME